MTREEAISIMKVIVHMLEEKYDTDRVEDAVDMAIKALEQEPCEDCISREAAIDALGYNISITSDEGIDKYRTVLKEMLVKIYDTQVAQIKALPSVQPKTGRWITQWNAAHQKEYYYCSECREEFSYDGETGIKMSDYDFCPNCGAKMVEP